jgi:glycosyltransferase involved in cell wall biosynthesis
MGQFDLKYAPSDKTQHSTESLRVMMICQRDDPATGGAARVAVELSKRLPEHNIDAKCVFVYGPPGALSVNVRSQTRWLKISSSRQAIRGMYLLWREIQNFKPDIIYHHDGLIWTHIVSWAFPRKLVIGHAHLDGPQPAASRKRRLAHWIHGHTYKRLIAVSEFTRGRWLALGYPKENAVVLRNGIDGFEYYPAKKDQKHIARSGLNLPANARIMASVGRLHSEMKGTDDFLRVLAKMSPAWHGLIAGSGPDRAALEQLTVDLGIKKNVHFVGTIDPVRIAYHAADVLVITSHYEPFGLVAIEALACGLPIVAFECDGGLNEILAGAKQPIIKNREICAMALEIEDIASKGPKERDRLLEKYSWSAITQGLATLIRKWV